MGITAKELAKKLNLSEAAISMALNHKPGVSTKTRNLVLEEAKKCGYDFSRIAEREEAEPIKGTICFMIYRKSGAIVCDSPFFSELSEGIETGCKRHGYQLSISYLYEDDHLNEQIDYLKNSYFAGFILLATEMTEHSMEPFATIKKPFVVLDSYFDSLPYNCVLINNKQGAALATDYLIQKRKKQPGYLHSSYPIGNFEERADGFYKAIRAHGFSTSKSIVHRLTPSMEGAYEDMKELLQQGEEPAASYFADNDLIAAGAMKAFREAGYRIPEDISIVGFDNQPLCNYVDPSLTTVHVPKKYLGEMAAERLSQILTLDQHECMKLEIRTTLIKRKSVK